MRPETTIRIAEDRDDLAGLRSLLEEYLTWDIDQLRALSGVALSAAAYVQNSFDEIDLYFPPRGRLMLARHGDALVGMAFLKPVAARVCEIKRMYVIPAARGQNLGRVLLSRLIEEARAIGYAKILLDSAVYMNSAHRLYRDLGFRDVDYYPQGETEEALKDFMVYMELTLSEDTEDPHSPPA